jgi:hypothetical protein
VSRVRDRAREHAAEHDAGGASLSAQGKDNKAESDKLFNEGIALFNNKDYVAAHQHFSDAYGKYPSPSSLFNMARTELLLDRCPDSISHYRAYLALPDNPKITETNRSNARQDMATCIAKVGRLNVKAPPGTTVSIDGTAALWVEGEPIDVPPGSHDVQLKNALGAKTRKVDAPAGKVTFVEWEDPVSTVTNPPTNTTPETNPNTTTPPTNPPGNTTPPPPTPVNNTPKWIAGGALAGVGVIGLVLGGVFYGMNQSAKSDVDSKASSGACINPSSAACSDLLSARDSQDTYKTLSAVTLIGGGVFLAAGAGVLIWAALSPRSKPANALRLSPYYAGTSFGLTGEF